MPPQPLRASARSPDPAKHDLCTDLARLSRLRWNGADSDLWKRNLATTRAVDAHAKDTLPFGVRGMRGKVWEWTATAYDEAHRVIRGGGWLSVASSR
ncbi:MAG: SUMF1/EgtB/PvdO family nonheme iron enzyme, partial [Deltaproteobacteria bacterium]|nr:SUMF1/EgtB/PvdO family nonheme iron enzyme [Deltaproteobacteria bacterium]